MDPVNVPPISGIQDASKARVMLYQAGQPVHAALDSVGLLTEGTAASIYLTSATAASTYLPLTGGTLSGALAVAGNVNASGAYVSDSGLFIGNSGTAILANLSGAGTVYLRPNGYSSATGQATLSSGGNFAAAGFTATGSTGLTVTGTSGTNPYVQNLVVGNPNWATLAMQAVHFPAVWAGLQWDLGGTIYQFRNTGAFKAGGGAWLDHSDARIKNILGNYNQGLKELRTLHPKRFSYKGNDTDGPPEEGDTVPYKNSSHKTVAEEGTVFYGVTAQDVEPKFPEMITKSKAYIDGVEVPDMRTLDTSALIWALVNAVDELATMNEALASRVTALENAP